MAEIIIFPEYEKLNKEIKKLRTELSMLFLDRDELKLIICKNIEVKYMLMLGALECKAFEMQCAYQRLKRKAELIQARLNRQEKVDIKAIESTLDEEFAHFQQLLEERIGKMNEAIERSRCEALSQSETQEIKKLYRKIVKSLHPDIDTNSTPERQELFVKAINAYENGDLHTLRIIAEMAADSPELEIKESVMEELCAEHKRLTAMIEEVNSSIAKIKSEYPYILKEIVEDEEKTMIRKSELELIISQYKEIIAEYKERIERMMR